MDLAGLRCVPVFAQVEKSAGLFWIWGERVQQIIVDLGGQCVVWVQQGEMHSRIKRDRFQI